MSWKRTTLAIVSLLTVLTLLLSACAQPAPVVVEKQVPVEVEKQVVIEKPVVETVIVEKEVMVEKPVVETVIVEKEVVVEKPVVETVIVEKEAERPKLTVWVTTSYVPLADETLKRHILEWANARNVEVDLVLDALQVIEPMVNAGAETNTLPDVFPWHVEAWGPQFHHAGLLADVTDLIEKLDQQGGGIFEWALDAASDEEGVYFGIPTKTAPEVLYVRKDLLEANGLEAPETYEDVLEVAKALTKPGEFWAWGVALSPTDQYDAEMCVLSLLAGYGSSPYGPDGVTPNLDNDGTRQALALLKEAWDAGVIPPDTFAWDNSGNNTAYLGETSAMIYNSGSVVAVMRGVWGYGGVNKELLDKTMLLKTPAGPEGRKMMSYVLGFLIPKNSQHIDLAKDLVEWIMDPDRQLEYVKAAGGNAAAVYKDLAKPELWEGDPYMSVIMDSLNHAVFLGWPGKMTLWAAEAQRTHSMSQLIYRVLVEGQSIDDAIAETEANLAGFVTQFQ